MKRQTIPREATSLPPRGLTVAHEHTGLKPAFEQCSSLHGLERFVVASVVLDATRLHLRRHGARGDEAALCWAGTVSKDYGLITTAILFSESGHRGGVHVSAAHTGLLYAHCHARGLTLIAQVHSHPISAFHSDVDERLPHSAEAGFLSVVAPNLGACSYEVFDDWCVFEQTAYEVWREWDHVEKKRRLQALDSVVAIP